MTPRDLDRIEARLEELEHGQEDHHARIAAMEAKPSTTGPPINEAGITATFAAIFARLDALEADARAVGACLSAQVCMNSNTQDALERLESARIAAPVAPESVETGPGVPMEPGNATEAPSPNLADAAHEYVHDALMEIANALGVRTASDYEEGQDAPNFKLVERILATAGEVAAALRMYRKVQGCKVEGGTNGFVQTGARPDSGTWDAFRLLAWLKEGEA